MGPSDPSRKDQIARASAESDFGCGTVAAMGSCGKVWLRSDQSSMGMIQAVRHRPIVASVSWLSTTTRDPFGARCTQAWHERKKHVYNACQDAAGRELSSNGLSRALHATPSHDDRNSPKTSALEIGFVPLPRAMNQGPNRFVPDAETSDCSCARIA